MLKKLTTRFLSFCIFLFSISLVAQSGFVTGKITSPEGQPIPGVTVMQKGTSHGVVSNFDGEYQIELKPDSEILVFSYLGFRTVEIEVSAGSVLDVRMEYDDQSLEEVLVIGYGTQRKSDITGSVSSISSKDFEDAVVNSVDDILQGRSPGVLVTSSSGAPDAGSTIRIRGNNSISGSNAPLYVVDGTPISGSPNFDPQDIENMEVLKDASATAIYGSRGSNGVILISTKRGETGKTLIEVNFRTSVSEIMKTFDMLNGQDYAEYRNEANLALGRAIPYPNPEQYSGQGFDWQDEILRNGNRNEYGINISGGKDNINYFVSGNLLDDKGIILGSQYTRGNLRMNLDMDAFDDFLNLKFSFNGSHSKNQRAISTAGVFPDAGGPIFTAMTASPIVPSLNYSGFTGEQTQFYNPFLEVTEKNDRDFAMDLFANTQATFNFTEHLSYTFNGGIDFTQNNRDIFTPSTVGQGINFNGIANTTNNRNYDYIVINYLTYENDFNDKHDISGTAGVEYSEFNGYSNGASVTNFDLQILGSDNLGVGTGQKNLESNRIQSILKSGFLRLNYSFDDRYLFTTTLRADGSSRFAENEKWGYFPSAAFGWNISNEKFLEDSRTISNLKIRASYGATGSQSIAPYQSLARYGTTVFGLGNTPTLAYVPQSVANPDLRWETTKQLDIGLDVGIFNNRLDFTFDYFQKTTEDLLQSIQLPSQSGYSLALVNFGSIKNEGIEFGISAYPVNTGNFSWDTFFNFTSYKTKVIELGGNEEIFGPGMGNGYFGSGHIYRPGYEYGMLYGLKAIGLIQESDFDAAGNILVPTRTNDDTLGHWKFEDINGDGNITQDDRTVIGNPNPDFIFGWNNDFNYKNFSLNLFIQGSVGNDIYNTIGTVINSGFDNNEAYKNQTVDWYHNRWTPENPHNDIRYPSINSFVNPAANFMVEDGSYIRLKNVSLRYNLPLENSPITGIQFSITGTNLVTITDYTGFDPEVSSRGANSLAPGVDLGAYPRQKIYTLGINLDF